MHWLEDMKHRDIALTLNAPRPTVTRWFHRLRVPTQSCRRFTDKNLTSWLYKTGQLKKKPRYENPAREPRVNIDFFKKWSLEMAYILGYFAADGSMYANPRGSKYITFSSIDREILEKVKQSLNSRRKDRNNKMVPYVLTCFASANSNFLKEISSVLRKNIHMGKGCIQQKSGHLNYSKADSIKLFKYMYKGAPKALCLERKYNKFQKAIN